MEQTTINNKNRNEFYKRLYPVLAMPKQTLLDVSAVMGTKIIVDSTGWYYREHFPTEHILSIEHINTCKNFKLDKSKFDKIFNDISFPKIDISDPTVLILDHTVFLKYKTINQINELLSMMSERCNSYYIMIRGSMITLADHRFGDRIKDFVSVVPSGFLITKLSCDLAQYSVEMKKIKKYDIN
jgi:hypothetical protein